MIFQEGLSKKNNKWVFEEGTFNTNNSYGLRVEHVIKLLQDK